MNTLYLIVEVLVYNSNIAYIIFFPLLFQKKKEIVKESTSKFLFFGGQCGRVEVVPLATTLNLPDLPSLGWKFCGRKSHTPSLN